MKVISVNFSVSLSFESLLLALLALVMVQSALGQNVAATLPRPGCGLYNCAPPPPPPRRASAKSDCLAFNRLSDVYLQCGYNIHRLTRTGDITSFSISQDGEVLSVIREGSTPDQRLEVISLKDDSVKSSRPHVNGHLQATCGAQLLFEFDKANVKISDLETGKQSHFRQARDVRCSNNPSVRLVAELGNQEGSDLFLEDINGRRLISRGVEEFAISPRATYIAFEDGFRLCGIKLAEVGRDPICLEEVWPAGRMMVDDDGVVLTTEQTAEGCPYIWEKQRHVGHGWPCEALFSWLIGDRKDQLVGFLYRDPQLVTSDAAAKILASHSAEVSSKGDSAIGQTGSR